jgi:hypothetical protein
MNENKAVDTAFDFLCMLVDKNTDKTITLFI